MVSSASCILRVEKCDVAAHVQADVHMFAHVNMTCRLYSSVCMFEDKLAHVR